MYTSTDALTQKQLHSQSRLVRKVLSVPFTAVRKVEQCSRYSFVRHFTATRQSLEYFLEGFARKTRPLGRPQPRTQSHGIRRRHKLLRQNVMNMQATSAIT